LSRSELGDDEGALLDLQRSRGLAEQNGSRSGQAVAMMGLSVLYRRAGRLDEALELGESAYGMLELQVERMAPHGHAMMLSQLSRVRVARGELAQAQELSRQAVDLALASDDMPLASTVVESLAEVDLLAGEAGSAVRVLGLAAAMRGMRTIPDSDVRRTHEQLRAVLGDDGFEATYAAGAGQTKDEAVAELRVRFPAP
jgi:tetratricopeptide (TPR) repeat protein